MSTKAELWAAQIATHPNSVELTPQEVFQWVHEGNTQKERYRRSLCINQTIQFETFVIYRTEILGGFMGIRFGIDGHEYLSGLE